MSEAKDERTVGGGCFCGAVRFEVRTPTAFCGHCHCTMCRRVHGAGFVTWFGVDKSRFRITAGEETLTHLRSSSHGSRWFCSSCGSSLFCSVDEHPEIMDVVLANVEGPIDREPEGHYYFGTRVPWIELGDDLPRHHTTPGAADH